MNIGMFTDTYFPQVNGVVTSITLLKKALEKEGYKVYIFTPSDPNTVSSLEHNDVFRIPSLPFPSFPERRIAIGGLFKLSKKVKELNLHVIHTHTEFSIGLIGKVLAKKYHIPIVHTYHTLYEDYLHYIGNGKVITPSMVKRATQLFCRNTDKLVVPSGKTKQVLESYELIREIEVIPTGIDFEQFKKKKETILASNELKTELNIKGHSILLTVGRLSEEKNIEATLSAMPEILQEFPQTLLLVVRDGPAKASLINLANKLGVKKSIYFVGEVNWKDIQKYYQLGDLFISSSTSETQGLIIFEVVASKIPIIAKRDSIIEGIIDDEVSGYCFQSDSKLADTVCKALNKRENYNRMAECAFKNIEQMSLQTFGENILNVYEKAITENIWKRLHARETFIEGKTCL